jgi:F5/8 type C domain
MPRQMWMWAAMAALLLAGTAQARVTIKASSTYDDSQTDRSPVMAFDGRLDTTWSEGQAGEGTDEWIEIDLGKATPVDSISIWGGDFSDGTKRFGEQNRLKLAQVVFSTSEGEVTKDVEFGDRFTRHEVRIGKSVRKVRVVIKEVYSGTIFDNTHIAEIAFDYPTQPAEINEKITKWKDGKDYPAAKEAYDEALEAAYQGCKAGEQYSAHFKFLAWAAVHGPYFVQEKVPELVPEGFRANYLEFDQIAVEHLQRLKDVNAIPYLETAQARAVGDDVYWLQDLVKAFRAHEELISSKRHNIPNWGITGLEPGALNGRNEPIAIDISSEARIYVADVGNNRLQWFTQDGRVEGYLGKEEGIAWKWFGEEGDPYATGAAPGGGPREFEQPLALAVGNYDIVAVIDATKRVQTFTANEDGGLDPVGNWVIKSAEYIGPGRGCATPIVTWWGDNFYFLIGKEVWGFTSKGEQVVSFKTNDEIIAGVILDGKLLVHHDGDNVMEYAIEDGFKQGSFLKKGVPEDGSEDWDLATDSADNLYVATDAGIVYIYNKRGKFVRQVEMFTNPKNRMRIAIDPTMTTMYVTAQDQIHKVDLAE